MPSVAPETGADTAGPEPAAVEAVTVPGTDPGLAPGVEDATAVAAEEPEENHVDIICPKCRGVFEVPESYRGEQAQCPDCGITFLIPTTGSIGRMVAPAPPAAVEETTAGSEPPDEVASSGEPDEKFIGVICPGCKTPFELPERRRGEQAQCPECGCTLAIPTMGSIGVMIEPAPAAAGGEGRAPAGTGAPGPGTPAAAPETQAQGHKAPQFKDSRTAKISRADLANTMKPVKQPAARQAEPPTPPPAPDTAGASLKFRRR